MAYKKKPPTWLAHHGIEGQRWGIKHGPPYPLDSKVSTGSSLREGVSPRTKTIAKSAAGGAALGAVVGGIFGGPVGAAASAGASALLSAGKAALNTRKSKQNNTKKVNSKNDKVEIIKPKELDKTQKEKLESFINNVKVEGQEEFAHYALEEMLEHFVDLKSPEMYDYANNLKKIRYSAKRGESNFEYEKSNGNTLDIYADEMGNPRNFVEARYSKKISQKLEQSLIERIKTDDHASLWVKDLDGGENIEFLSREDNTSGKIGDQGKTDTITQYVFTNDYGLFTVEGHYNSNNKFVVHDITVDD